MKMSRLVVRLFFIFELYTTAEQQRYWKNPRLANNSGLAMQRLKTIEKEI